MRHPLGGTFALGAFSIAVAAAFWRPKICLVAVLVLIPVIGLAPWSGWLIFEEADLAILAFAAGGGARWAATSDTRRDWRWPKPVLLLSLLIACTLVVSMARGFSDAGGFAFAWDQGYEGPMNSFRLAKSFFLALLITQVVTWQDKNDHLSSKSYLAFGLALSLGSVALAALWERLAYTGLLNFSSDYRSTALFWEMHVGGAALDGWLLLTAPFGVWAIRNSTTPITKLAAIALAFLGSYAVVTTFSRATYLAAAIAIPFLMWRLSVQNTTRSKAVLKDGDWRAWQWIAALIVFGAMVIPIFVGAGYRGLLALFGLTFIAMSAPPLIGRLTTTSKLSSIAGGLFFGAFLVALSNLIPKGPYFLFACLFIAATVTLIRNRKNAPAPNISWRLTLIFIAMLPATSNVAWYWGGTEALPGAFLTLSILAMTVAVGTVSKRPLWPESIIDHAQFIGAGTAVAFMITALLGGAYIGERFSTTDKDLKDRFEHWQQSLAMLTTPGDYLFGKGPGRFPQNYFFWAPGNILPGSYHIGMKDGNQVLSLTGGNYSISFGDILRITQRIDRGATGPFNLRMNVRAKTDAGIYIEVCNRHLLYPENCIIQHVSVKASPETWQPFALKIDGVFLEPAPTFRTFSIGLLTQRGAVDVDNLALSTVGTEVNLLSNGDFSLGSNRWFMTSDRSHLPWHAKNLAVNVLFDQGLIGLALFALLSVTAFWQSAFGKARNHPLAPYFAASLVGFWIVGLFDSLLDAPRVAFVYYLISLYVLVLPYSTATMHQGKQESA